MSSLWLSVIAPIIFMPIVYVLGRRIGKNVSWVALIPLLYSSLTFLGLLGNVAVSPIGEYFDWLPGIRFGFYVDGLSAPIALTIAVLATVIVIYSQPYMAHS